MKPLKPIHIQVTKPTLLSGPVLRLVPCLLEHLGGELCTIVFLHLCYCSKMHDLDSEVGPGARLSLTRLQKQVPFVSRRWLIKILRDLEVHEWISVHRSKRVNVYVPCLDWADAFGCAAKPNKESIVSTYIVLPRLAQIVDLSCALFLQQIHIRCHQKDGSIFVIRSLEQWHSEVFPFWGTSTVKRTLKKLSQANLILKKPYNREDGGTVMSYRVNYIRLAELLSIPTPQVENPNKYDESGWNTGWKDWTNPVTLTKQKDMPPESL